MRSLALATLLVATWVSPTFASQLSSMFVSQSHDFGTVARAAKTEHRFYFDNPFNQPIKVRSVRTSCGCTTPIVETHDVPVRGRGSILAKFNTATHTGQRAATLTVTFEKPIYGEVQLHIKGYVRTDVVFNPGEAAFGSIEQGAEKTINVTLDYAGRPDWKIVGMNTSEAFISAKAQEVSRANGRVRYDLKVTVAPDAPAGPLQSQLIVLTNDRNLTRVPLRIDATIVPGLTASPSTLALGDILPDEESKQLVLVKGQRPFLVTGIESDVLDVDSELPTEAKTMHPIQLVVKPLTDKSQGEIKGTVVIKTDLEDRPSIELVVVYRLKTPAASSTED